LVDLAQGFYRNWRKPLGRHAESFGKLLRINSAKHLAFPSLTRTRSFGYRRRTTLRHSLNDRVVAAALNNLALLTLHGEIIVLATDCMFSEHHMTDE